MFPHRSLATVLVATAAIALSGCLNANDSSSGGSSLDEEGIQNVIFEEMGAYADPDVRWYDDEEGAGIARDAIDTYRWRREVLSFERNAVIEIERPEGEAPTAFVTVTGEAIGLLHLLTVSGDEAMRYTKDFDDIGTRSTMLQRVRTNRPTTRHHGWQLIAVSGVEIASTEATRRIESVRIRTDGVDETITGVSELVPLADLLHLPVNAEVTVTVTTGDATDSVWLHYRHRGWRRPLESNGDGTFTGVFLTGERSGPRHIVVDVLSHGTLFDTEEAYDNAAWGIPLIVGSDISPGGDAIAGRSVVF